jgi:hypothetical protein
MTGLLWLAISLLSLPSQAADKYRINNGTSLIINEFAACKSITNNSGRDLMVPTKSAVGWASFHGNAHSGVSISTPVSDCGTVLPNFCSVHSPAGNCGQNCGPGTKTWSGCPNSNYCTGDTVPDESCADYDGGHTSGCGGGTRAWSGCAAAASVSCGTGVYNTCSDAAHGTHSTYCGYVGTNCASCTLPWGATLPHGQSVEAYRESSVDCSTYCGADGNLQMRSCNNGVLSGDNNHNEPFCQAGGANGC